MVRVLPHNLKLNYHDDDYVFILASFVQSAMAEAAAGPWRPGQIGWPNGTTAIDILTLLQFDLECTAVELSLHKHSSRDWPHTLQVIQPTSANEITLDGRNGNKQKRRNVNQFWIIVLRESRRNIRRRGREQARPGSDSPRIRQQLLRGWQ